MRTKERIIRPSVRVLSEAGWGVAPIPNKSLIMTEEYPTFGLSYDWLVAIGCIVVQWSALESALNSHLRTLLHQPAAESHRPKHLSFPFSKRIDLYSKVAPIFYAGDALKLAEKAIRMMRAVKDDSEWIVHGLSMEECDGDLVVFKSDAMRTNKNNETNQRFSLERVVMAVMEDARLCLVTAYASVSEKFLSY
jgi:hypothetical protein